MSEVIVFAGTTEGYGLCRFLSRYPVSALACVATDYGKNALEETDSLCVHAGRLSREEMEALFLKERPSLVLDATHPYAVEVTENIRQACQKTGCSYQRVLRPGSASDAEETIHYVRTTEEAVEYLEGTRGGIFLTVGSKELEKYTGLTDYKNRLYARVLSLPSVISACSDLGLEGAHLIGMQGPFTRECNCAMLRQTGSRYLVTKDTGAAGGFEEKIEAARECGVTAVVIGRPLEESGISVWEARRLLIQMLHLHPLPQITVLGIGMGTEATLTQEGREALQSAELVIGARRVADAVRQGHHQVHYEYREQEIRSFIELHPEYESILIALSGDVGFYSGARKLLPALQGLPVRILCGISSVSYFMSKIQMSWEDAVLASAHGRKDNLVTRIRDHRKVFAILGSPDGVAKLAQKLTAYGMGGVLLYVGENLSYEDERIFCKEARELTGYTGTSLSVLCAYHPEPVAAFSTHGIPDEAFHRGHVPMTKEEIRAVSLAKLRLSADSVCYDIGAGTGSVSVEMALRMPEGTVYAIEKKPEACALIESNRRAFAADNLEIVTGMAPEALEALPRPTHAFIGGSSGKLAQIVSLLLEKNPQVRIVINCITLETVSEALKLLTEKKFSWSETVQVSVARAKEVGRYHMMTGENPIYIITCQNTAGGQEEHTQNFDTSDEAFSSV